MVMGIQNRPMLPDEVVYKEISIYIHTDIHAYTIHIYIYTCVYVCVCVPLRTVLYCSYLPVINIRHNDPDIFGSTLYNLPDGTGALKNRSVRNWAPATKLSPSLTVSPESHGAVSCEFCNANRTKFPSKMNGKREPKKKGGLEDWNN